MDGRAGLDKSARCAPDHTAHNANACSWAPFGEFWMSGVPFCPVIEGTEQPCVATIRALGDIGGRLYRTRTVM